jgi:hypothetical protein
VCAERADSSLFVDSVRQSVFTSPETPVQEGPAFWDYQAKLLPGVQDYKGEDVRKWDNDQVAAFVASLPGCQMFQKTFLDQVSWKRTFYICIMFQKISQQFQSSVKFALYFAI